MCGFIRAVRSQIRNSSGRKKRSCPTDEILDDYLKDKLEKKQERKVDLHLFECARCFKRVLEKKDLIDGVKIVFKHKSEMLEKAARKAVRRKL